MTDQKSSSPVLDPSVLNTPGFAVAETQLPWQKTYKGAAFPLVVRCTKEGATLSETEEWVTSHQESLEELLRRHGSIMFRGFPLPAAQDFSGFVKAFKGWPDMPYDESLSYAVRLPVCDRVCTTNEGKSGGLIWHHELAQTPIPVSKLFFYCENPASEGGATGICPSHIVYDRLLEQYPNFIEECEKKGVLYSATLPTNPDTSKGVGRSWKSYFHVNTIEEAEARMKHLGYTWTWNDDGTLTTTTPVLSAVRVATHHPDNVKVFFNQMIAQYLANAKEFTASTGSGSALGEKSVEVDHYLKYGDGTSVDGPALEYAFKMCNETAVDLDWQAGDVALIDNYLVMHARRPFEGPRRILASLVK